MNFSHLLIRGLNEGLKIDQRFLGFCLKESSIRSDEFIENYKPRSLEVLLQYRCFTANQLSFVENINVARQMSIILFYMNFRSHFCMCRHQIFYLKMKIIKNLKRREQHMQKLYTNFQPHKIYTLQSVVQGEKLGLATW